MTTSWQFFVAGLLCLLNARVSAQQMSAVMCVCNQGSPSDMFASADVNGPAVRQMGTNECIATDINEPSASQMMYAVVIGESLYYILKAENIQVDSCVSVPSINGTTTNVLVPMLTAFFPNTTTPVMLITEASTIVTTNVPTTMEPFTDSTTESTTQAILSSTTVATTNVPTTMELFTDSTTESTKQAILSSTTVATTNIATTIEPFTDSSTESTTQAILSSTTVATTNVPTTFELFTDSTTESTTQALLSSTTVATVEITTQDMMTTTPATEKVCEHGWHLLSNRCYMFKGTHQSWLDANLFCQKNGGHLVFIESQNEQDRIASYIQHHPNIGTAFWIGANDRLTEGDWRWDDPNDVDKHVTYTNWGQGEPNNHHEEDCAILIRHDMHWNDESCEDNHGLICETAATEVVATTAPDNSANCDDGWRPHNDHCYLFKTSATDKLTWSQAQRHCSNLGAYLVAIDSTNEQNFIHNSLNHIITHAVHDDIQSSLWIGATDHAREGHWQWVMGEQNINVAFTAWSHGEPNNHINHNEDCAVVRGTHNYEWNDYPCDLTLHYICEKEKGSSLQPIVVG